VGAASLGQPGGAAGIGSNTVSGIGSNTVSCTVTVTDTGSGGAYSLLG
tara:strand:- start:500 stop:643 length:144 start_codon:yes stop_codon:yes gene_type:complete